MGESFVVDIETIRKNDYCLHPAHYKGLCPYHHPDKVDLQKKLKRNAELEEKIKQLQAKIDKLRCDKNAM